MSTAFAPPPPINRGQDLSPVSIDSGSEWSGVNNYNSGMRSDSIGHGHMGYAQESLGSPDSTGLSAHPPRSFGPPSIDGSGRRRPSEAGSQPSSRAVSVAHSRSSDGTISDQNSRRYRKMEMELQQHYTILRNYLKGGAPQPPRPNRARDKLLRLSPVQFHELSTDVFDELQRRQAAAPIPGRPPRRDNVPPFLQPRQEFHEKRNQARQKLSSLQTSRFRDLSTDVFCELERRFPHFNAPDGRRRDSARSVSSRGGRGPPPRVNTGNGSISSPVAFPPRSGSMPGNGGPPFENTPLSATSTGSDFGRPVPKQFQSSTITPNKSTMVEDDEDDDMASRGSDAFGLESAITSPASDRDTPATSVANHSRELRSLQDKVSDLESNLREKDEHTESLKLDFEKQLDSAVELNRSLKNEIEKLQTEFANRQRELQAQVTAAKRDSEDGGAWKAKHDQLDRDHQRLQEMYVEQQKITEEVSRQGESFLREMRAMAAEGGDGGLEREEKLQLEVNRLSEELGEWKGKYAKVKSQLRSVKTASVGTGIQVTSVLQASTESSFRRPDGLIKDIHITKFQIAIDELLQAARVHEAVAVMEYVKPIAIAVRNISLDVECIKPATKEDEIGQRRMKLKERVAATANNVITASKNFAAAGGISPVSLLDAAASHLSAAVVDLARAVKIGPSPVGETDDDEEIIPPPDGTPEPMNGAGYFNMSRRLRRESPTNSVYSALSTPEGEEARAQSAANDARDGSNVAAGGPGSTGLGIQAGLQLKEDDTELQELKIYLENQTDLLVQTIQLLVSSIRNEEAMTSIHEHISGIVDVIENVLSAAEGAMDDPSWYQAMLKDRATPAVHILLRSKDELLMAVNDPTAQVNGPSSKTFTQRLPPLAFRLARETKDLVARIESVEAGSRSGVEDDFS